MLGDLNARAVADREALAAEVAVARSDAENARGHAGVADEQLLGAADREKQLVNRLAAELADKASGAEALAALESRCANAEARVEATTALKWAVQYHRKRGIHTTPTVLVNGVENGLCSSGWTADQWDKFLEPLGADGFNGSKLK